jgi:hypothetical protein
MNCSNYVHNDPIGGSKFISGTTCTGTVAYYTLTLGQEVCMDNSKPLINLNGLVISGDCTGVTPTPTPTPIDFCYISGFSYYDAVFQCPNDGLDYFDRYGVWYFSAYTGSNFTQSHPQLNFTLTNGTDFATVSIEPGQYFTEFVYPKIDFRYTDTGCISTTYPDWYVYTPATTQCFLTPTPTNTVTPTVTPTITLTSSVTPTQTPTPSVTETTTPTPSVTETTTPTVTSTPTNTQTPTNTSTVTPTITSTVTPTITLTQTPTQTQTPTNTSTVTPTITSTVTPSITSTQTPTVTPTITLTMTPSPTSGPFNPSRISNLQYWFDASSGATVSSWTNYGLLGGSITQSDAILQPEVKTDSFMGAWTGTTMSFTNRQRMFGTFANVNFSATTQFLVFKQVSRATFGDIIGYRIWDGVNTTNIFSQWLSRTSTPPGNAFNLPFSGISLSSSALVGSPSLISIETSGLTQGTALIDMEINDTTQVMTYSASTAYLSGNTFQVGGVQIFGGTNIVEFAELIVYNKVLTPSEFLEVENYLKTKYDYPTWIIPTPTPTSTVTPTITPTSTVTPTITPTISLTPTNTITPTITQTPNNTTTPSVTPTITPTRTQTPTITPTKTPTPTRELYQYYNVELYNCVNCDYAGITGVLKIYWDAIGGPNNGWYYGGPGSSVSYKFKIISPATGPTYDYLLNPNYQGSNTCGSFGC